MMLIHSIYGGRDDDIHNTIDCIRISWQNIIQFEHGMGFSLFRICNRKYHDFVAWTIRFRICHIATLNWWSIREIYIIIISECDNFHFNFGSWLQWCHYCMYGKSAHKQISHRKTCMWSLVNYEWIMQCTLHIVTGKTKIPTTPFTYLNESIKLFLRVQVVIAEWVSALHAFGNNT